MIPGEHVRARKHKVVHHDVDEGSIEQAGDDRITHKDRQDTSCEDEECCPDECDKEVKGEAE